MSALLILPAENQSQDGYVETAVDPGYVEAVFRSNDGGSIMQVRGNWWKIRVPFPTLIRAYSMAKDDLSSGYMTTYTPEEVDKKWVITVEKVLKGD